MNPADDPSLDPADDGPESALPAADLSHLTPGQQKTLQTVPEYLKPTFIRAYGAGSRSAAIKAFCSACVGHVRKDVTNCSATGCPLYPYRPWQD